MVQIGNGLAPLNKKRSKQYQKHKMSRINVVANKKQLEQHQHH